VWYEATRSIEVCQVGLQGTKPGKRAGKSDLTRGVASGTVQGHEHAQSGWTNDNGGKMTALTEEEVKFNRKLVVDMLRINPFAHKRLEGKLTDKNDGYCAVGEAAEALHVSPQLLTDSEVYTTVGQLIDDDTYTIFHKNDYGYSFRQVGDWLAKRWGI
jgi:hypothetical protein